MVGLSSQTRGSRALSEVSREHRGEEGVEDDVGATNTMSVLSDPMQSKEADIPEDGQRKPQQEHKLEGEVEGEPVDNVDEALKDAGHDG